VIQLLEYRCLVSESVVVLGGSGDLQDPFHPVALDGQTKSRRPRSQPLDDGYTRAEFVTGRGDGRIRAVVLPMLDFLVDVVQKAEDIAHPRGAGADIAERCTLHE
jgi:hypothetical protein